MLLGFNVLDAELTISFRIFIIQAVAGV